MHLIVGLGNPGAKYAGNRHNVGMMAIDEIARRHNFQPFKNKFRGQYADGMIDGERALLLKPETYMNKSGDSVAEICSFFKIPVEQVTVIYDELDLAPGKIRVKRGGGTGGHNGLRSIDPQIGTPYQRVRVGIGHPGHKDLVSNYVLSDFAKADQSWLDVLLPSIADHIGLLIKDDAGRFMNKVALDTNPTASNVSGTQEKQAQKPKRAAKPDNERPSSPAPTQGSNGPMADMLKKLFGDKT